MSVYTDSYIRLRTNPDNGKGKHHLHVLLAISQVLLLVLIGMTMYTILVVKVTTPITIKTTELKYNATAHDKYIQRLIAQETAGSK